jgi:multicomponent Na+:H+ antiporter subunit F
MTAAGMTVAAGVLIVVLALSLALAAYRMLRGPGYADRFVALDMITAIVVALAALTALVTGRSAFFDVALGVALINFVSTCAFAAFLERRGGNE